MYDRNAAEHLVNVGLQNGFLSWEHYLQPLAPVIFRLCFNCRQIGIVRCERLIPFVLIHDNYCSHCHCGFKEERNDPLSMFPLCVVGGSLLPPSCSPVFAELTRRWTALICSRVHISRKWGTPLASSTA